jgi:hypothetical protein
MEAPMTKRFFSLGLGALLLAALVGAAPQAPTKESALRCLLTGKKIEKCCCEQRDGKLYCPLAKKTIEKCCCEAAGASKLKKNKACDESGHAPHLHRRAEGEPPAPVEGRRGAAPRRAGDD